MIRHLLEIYNLPKLQRKLLDRVGHFLALTINATAQKDERPRPEAENQEGSTKPAKVQRTFNLLDDPKSRQDSELRSQLEDTVIEMLSPTQSSAAVHANGIQIASLMSDYRDDRIFLQLMKLLANSTVQRTRESIIKSMRVPYSDQSLIFMGKRLRDSRPHVAKLIFDQLRENGVTISNFPGHEARLLILTEGFTRNDPQVRDACIDFLRPTVLEYAAKNDLAGLLKLIEVRLAFGNQYYGRIPGYMTLAILEILDSDVTLATYLEQVVLKKLRKLAGLPLEARKPRASDASALENDSAKRELDEYDLFSGAPQPDANVEMKAEDAADGKADPSGSIDAAAKEGTGEDQGMDVDESEQGPITFEEVLLLRMAFELNKSTSSLRTQYYLDALERILPEFREYRAITLALCHMDEPDLPQIDPSVEKIWPYPEGQQGFTRRAILGEWIKFSIQLNVEDEVVRKSLTSLCFELVRRVEYSFSDYEHLLRPRRQLITASELENASANTLQTLLKVVTDED